MKIRSGTVIANYNSRYVTLPIFSYNDSKVVFTIVEPL